MHHVSTTLRARLRRGCALGGCSLGLRVSPAPPMHHVNTTLRSRLCFDGCGLGLRVIHPASLIHSRSRWAVHQRLAGHHCSRCPALYGTAATALHHHCRRCSCSPPPTGAAATVPHHCVRVAAPLHRCCCCCGTTSVCACCRASLGHKLGHPVQPTGQTEEQGGR